jgi:hypothetical protein
MGRWRGYDRRVADRELRFDRALALIMGRVSLQIAATWSLLAAFLALAWWGAAQVCERIGIAPGHDAWFSGACLLITLVAALITVTTSWSPCK